MAVASSVKQWPARPTPSGRGSAGTGASAVDVVDVEQVLEGGAGHSTVLHRRITVSAKRASESTWTSSGGVAAAEEPGHDLARSPRGRRADGTRRHRPRRRRGRSPRNRPPPDRPCSRGAVEPADQLAEFGFGDVGRDPPVVAAARCMATSLWPPTRTRTGSVGAGEIISRSKSWCRPWCSTHRGPPPAHTARMISMASSVRAPGCACRCRSRRTPRASTTRRPRAGSDPRTGRRSTPPAWPPATGCAAAASGRW